MNTYGHGVIIEDGAKIGKNNHFGDYVIIRSGVTIGNNNLFGAFTIVGDRGGVLSGNSGFLRGVKIGNNNDIKSHVVIKAGESCQTKVGSKALIMDFVNIGHDCQIANNCVIATGCRIAGYCKIEKNVTLGMNVVVRNRKEIPEGVKIGMASIVTRSCQLWKHGVFAGSPPRFVRSDNQQAQ